jgi:hypothetical protein
MRRFALTTSIRFRSTSVGCVPATSSRRCSCSSWASSRPSSASCSSSALIMPPLALSHRATRKQLRLVDGKTSPLAKVDEPPQRLALVARQRFHSCRSFHKPQGQRVATLALTRSRTATASSVTRTSEPTSKPSGGTSLDQRGLASFQTPARHTRGSTSRRRASRASPLLADQRPQSTSPLVVNAALGAAHGRRRCDYDST